MFKKINAFLLLLVTIAQAQTVDPLRAKDAASQQQWVDSILSKMSVEEKIGQLFMIQAYSNKDEKHQNEVIKMIEKYHIGNLIFMQGTPEKQVKLNNLYQSKSKIPLLIGFDGEWGLDMRLKHTYRFPWNMTLGAIQNKNLIEKLGNRIGQHCKRIGIHVNFAPVVDINTNPYNPIIGNRSFGESKENVAEASIAFTKGMQKAGVLANAKHFPGHGDTATDSHLTLPTIQFSKERIDTLELYPFKKQFDAGVASVMTAHLNIPSLEPDSKLPSSLSKLVVTDLLKKQLGFNGLIFTDGLNMKGAANYASPAAINLAAILAGNDMLLIPQDIPRTIRYFLQAYKTGMLTQERLDFSVRKILRAKYLVGLHQYKPLPEDHIRNDLNTIQDELLHRELLKNALTIIKNTKRTLPIQHLEDKNIAYVKLGEDSGDDFLKMLQNYTKVDEVSSKHLGNLIYKLKKYNLVIVGFHKSNKHPWKPYKFTDKELVWLQEIARNKTVILDVFSSPYALLQLKSFTNIDAIMVSYQNSVLAQQLTAQALFGAFNVMGKLPVSINNQFTTGTSVYTPDLGVMQYTIPEAVGMSSDSLRVIEQYIDTILKKKMTPGGQILIARHGQVIYNKAFGYHTGLKKRRVKKSDIYDLASLTKILATLPMIMTSDEHKKLSIHSNLQDLLPDYKDSNKGELVLKDVLSHYARLKSWIPFYTRTQNPKTKRNSPRFYSSKKSKRYAVKVADNLYMDAIYKDSITAIIKESDLREKTGYKYSDLGYYIMKDVLERKYKKPLNTLASTHFYKPLGMNRTSYLPLQKYKKSEIVPTEKDTYFRNQLIHGYVHDMGAAMQGGIGGHAGLFANANDVAKIMQMYLQKGYYGGRHYFSEATFDRYNKRYYADTKNRRGLGFDKPQINPREKPTCGCVSEESFGHSGFTGTYTWADPQTGILYVFLSNRVYPTAKNKGLVKSNMRTKIQRVIENAMIQ